MRNKLLSLFVLVLLASGCEGSGELSLTEYVEQTNVLAERASREGEAIVGDAQRVSEFTPQILQDGLERGVALRTTLQEAVDGIEPPDQIADLHNLMWDWHEQFIPIEAALAVRAGATEHTEEGWNGFSDSAEMVAYRMALANGKQV